VPYGVFTDRPLQVKVSYWLTDLPRPGMANLVIRPRSQHQEYFDHYDTWDSVGLDRDEGRYPDHIALERRKRRLPDEPENPSNGV
jgi:hypothetical protein